MSYIHVPSFRASKNAEEVTEKVGKEFGVKAKVCIYLFLHPYNYVTTSRRINAMLLIQNWSITQ